MSFSGMNEEDMVEEEMPKEDMDGEMSLEMMLAGDMRDYVISPTFSSSSSELFYSWLLALELSQIQLFSV
jgi:hypothetical protein